MDTNIHPAFATILAENFQPVVVEQADGWLVISKFLRRGSVKPPYSYQYDADHYDDLTAAYEYFADLERGEIRGWQPVTIVACRGGVPLGCKKVLP